MAARKEGRERDGGRSRAEEKDGPQDVQAVLEELGEGASFVTVWRIASGKEYHLARWPAAEFTTELVQNHPYGGGGEYRIRIAGPRSSRNQSQWVRSLPLNIAGPANNGGGNGAPGVPGSAGVVKERPMWQEVCLAMAAPLAAALATVLTREKQTDPVLVALLQNVGKGGGMGPEVLQLMESARQNGLTMGERLGNAEAVAERKGDGSDDALTATIKEGMGMARDVVKAMATPASAPAPVVATAKVVDARQQTPGAAAQAPAVTDGPKWLAVVRKYMGVILGWADGKKSAQVKALSLVDDLPGEYQEELVAACESEDFVTDVLGLVPEFSSTPERRVWFTAFLEYIQDALTEEEGDGTTGASSEAAPGEGGAGSEAPTGGAGDGAGATDGGSQGGSNDTP